MTRREWLQQELNEINKAISTARAQGQSYQIGTRKKTNIDYEQLISDRDRIEEELAAESGAGLFGNMYVAEYPWR